MRSQQLLLAAHYPLGWCLRLGTDWTSYHTTWPALLPSESLDASSSAPWRASCHAQHQQQHGLGGLLAAPVVAAAWRSRPANPPHPLVATPA